MSTFVIFMKSCTYNVHLFLPGKYLASVLHDVDNTHQTKQVYL